MSGPRTPRACASLTTPRPPPRRQRGENIERWARTIAIPYTDIPPCAVPACPRAGLDAHGLCHYHVCVLRRHRRRVGDDRTDPHAWAATQTPYLARHQFSLNPLPQPLRSEVLYGLQQAEDWMRSLQPEYVRRLVDTITVDTLLAGTPARTICPSTQKGVRRLVDRLCSAVRAGFAEFTGVPHLAGDVIDLRALGQRSVKGQRLKVAKTADLGVVQQHWLKALLRGWTLTQGPDADSFARTLHAATLATRVLARRPDGGHDPAVLGYGDITAIVEAFRTALKKDGTLFGSSYRGTLAAKFFELLAYGRRTGALTVLPGDFARDPVEHRIRLEEANEDDIGKAIPEPVIRQLDAHLHTVGQAAARGRRYLAPDDLQLLYQTAYTLLRDTGRRPGEIVSLARDCLETHRDETWLRWDNHKARRNRRRLPITASTARAIRTWQTRRDQLTWPASGADSLFPPLGRLGHDRHMPTNYLNDTLRAWIDTIPQIHADAGTPVDVLCELMDHKSVRTTQRYYTVSLQRKREAVAKLSAHIVDQTGRSTPCSSTTYELRSVAVPYGGCTEPSNVKAGGSSCPIRFQCAGCGFYRPDPSYLPAIEQHINDLRADRETAHAMDAAEFVTTALSAQITAYEQVTDRMRHRLAALPTAERREIEDASNLLRKVRAGTSHTLLPLTVVNQHNPGTTL